MVRDAEEHAAEDKKRRDLIEAKNSADSAIYGYASESPMKIPKSRKKSSHPSRPFRCCFVCLWYQRHLHNNKNVICTQEILVRMILVYTISAPSSSRL